MPQVSMCSYLARRLSLSCQCQIGANRNNCIRSIMSPTSMGPMKKKMNDAKTELQIIPQEEKHWLCGGVRSVATAATLLLQSKIIAVPTDTIYGLAALASNTEAIQQLYEIKRRDKKKLLAICVGSVNDVPTYGITCGIPNGLLESLLPGPYTIILQRQPSLNPALNPGIDSIGIRVPNSKFIRSVAQIVGPIALTSANISNEPSSIHPNEFSALWPKLDAIFYDIPNVKKTHRVGSTIVDLSHSGYYKVVRHGIAALTILGRLRNLGLKNMDE